MSVIDLLIVTPLFAILFNIFKIYTPFAWYIPIFVMLLFLIKELMSNKIKIMSKKNIPLFLYFLLITLSCFFAQYKYEAFIGYNFEGLLTNIVYFGFFYVGLKTAKEDMFIDIKKIIIVSVVLCLLMIFKTNITYKLFSMREEDYYFIQGTFDQFNHAAYYLLIANICAIFMCLKTNKTIYYLINSVLIFTLILNDTFGAYIAYVITLIGIIIYYMVRKEKKRELLIIVFTFILMTAVTNRNNYNMFLNNIKGVETDANTFIETNSIDTIGTNRGALWKYAFKEIKENPIFGCGYENINYKYSKYGVIADKPHNIVLELCFANGIPAMIAFFSFVGLIILSNLKKIKELKSIELLSLIIILSYLINSLVGNQTLYVAPYFYFFLGFCAKQYYSKEYFN